MDGTNTQADHVSLFSKSKKLPRKLKNPGLKPLSIAASIAVAALLRSTPSHANVIDVPNGTTDLTSLSATERQRRHLHQYHLFPNRLYGEQQRRLRLTRRSRHHSESHRHQLKHQHRLHQHHHPRRWQQLRLRHPRGSHLRPHRREPRPQRRRRRRPKRGGDVSQPRQRRKFRRRRIPHHQLGNHRLGRRHPHRRRHHRL